MIREMIRILNANSATVLEDVVGLSAIFVMLVVVLHLPGYTL